MRVVVLGSYVHVHCLAVKSLPTSGASIEAHDWWQDHGGKGLNLAVGMHRLGLSVSLLLAVGDDAAGAAITELLQAEGLSTQHIYKLGQQSGFGIGLISADGQNVIAVYSGANNLLTTEHVKALAADIQQAKLVCAQFEIQPAIVLEAFRIAKNAQIQTLLNPSPWQRPSPELLGMTDILIVNEPEALKLFALNAQTQLTVDDWRSLDTSQHWTGKQLIVTLAERGAVLFQKQQAPCYLPAWKVQQLDPTGTGDAFTAGFTYAQIMKPVIEEKLLFANACGAILATQAGVLAALPKRAEVEAFIQQNPQPHLI